MKRKAPRWARGVSEVVLPKGRQDDTSLSPRPTESNKVPAAVGSNSLADLAHRIRQEHEATAIALARGIEHAIRAGELLIEAKAHPDLRHGQWLPWLEGHCAVSARTAQLYMQVARHRFELEANTPGLAHLTLEGAAKTLAKAVKSITTIDHDAHDGESVAPGSPPRFIRQTNDQISWAGWSWNPVTGCKHNCWYCYARPIAHRLYPEKFEPTFRPERLGAPANTRVPRGAADDPRLGRVFVCSMADLFGRWVEDESIEKVFAACRESPQWEYLFLTKFPQRYVGLQLPPTAWIGTTVDHQYRVKIAEEAFRKISGVRVKWLSLEPLLEPLEFTDLSMFDWIVIGSQTATRQPDGPVPEFAPPLRWVARIIAQADECGVPVYCKPNLLGITNPQSPGMELPQQGPRGADALCERAGAP
jgi:protein gp37